MLPRRLGRSLELNLGAVRSLVQGTQNAVVDAVENRLFGQEFHLGLGGVDIDIHRVGRKRQVQHTGGEFAHHHLVAVGFLQGCGQQPGFYGAVVDEKGLQGAAGTGVRRLGNEAPEAVAVPAAADLHHPGALPSVDAVDRSLESAGTGGGQHLLAVPDKGKGHFGMGQGLLLHGSGHTAAFHGVGFHEFHSGRGVEEQVPDNDGGAVGAACLRFLGDLAPFQMETGAADGTGGLGQNVDAADGSDGSQGFAPEAHGGNGSQVLRRAQLGGGVAQERGFRILG